MLQKTVAFVALATLFGGVQTFASATEPKLRGGE